MLKLERFSSPCEVCHCCSSLAEKVQPSRGMGLERVARRAKACFPPCVFLQNAYNTIHIINASLQ
ncbi:hypothetical protein CDEST_05775 [Colletotrichum destructivum]|uniref:Uncharacterized protein n=1 Tax=Colletotrichum destructivum TaxID=34406 RepID=A0AAX4IC96_9PEZI|nr:hypothetical protein CDEST_05775 [Colletotrichum destructivum]